MENLLTLVQAYRKFLLELGDEFRLVRDTKAYEGFADTFIDMCKSPEIGFTPSEVETLMKMSVMFCLLTGEELPSHHSMKLLTKKKVDMELLNQARYLTVTDFRESLKDKELGTQERTYKYEIIKRSVESGSIKRVYGDEIKEALKQIQEYAV